jgi:hypothetical protein
MMHMRRPLATATVALALLLGLSNTWSPVSLIAKPSALSLVLTAPTCVTAGSPFDLTVRVQDARGTRAGSYRGTVQFTTSGDATLPAAYTFTAADKGVHTFVAALDTNGGHWIRAQDTADPSLTGNVTVFVAPAGPASVVATGGTPQSAAVGRAFSSPLTATVLDACGTPVAGTTVAFTAPTSGSASAVLSAESVVTGTDGTASVTATANDVIGSYVVTAVASGVAAPAAFELTNSAADAAGQVTARIDVKPKHHRR